MDFWEHLEELRGCLLKALVAVALCAVAAFCCKDWLFALVMAPSKSDFITYRLFSRLTGVANDFHIDLFNPELAQQFLVHMKVALWMGLLLVSPYLLYLLFHFVAPGLYAHERRYALRAVGSGYVMFLLGVALNYLLIFPHLPGECRRAQPDSPLLVYKHPADALFPDGRGVRAASALLAAGKDRAVEARFHAQIQETCRCGHPYHRRRHHSFGRCHDPLDGGAAHLCTL